MSNDDEAQEEMHEMQVPGLEDDVRHQVDDVAAPEVTCLADIMNEADDEWAPLEAWKIGDFAWVTVSEQRLAEAFTPEKLGPADAELSDDHRRHMGEVGRVGAVGKQTVDLFFKGSGVGVTFPHHALKKTVVVEAAKGPGVLPEDMGLLFRETVHGGLQLLGCLDGSDAYVAGFEAYTGWWLTHVGGEPVTTVAEFGEAGGENFRLEKRITLPFGFAAGSLEEKVEGAVLMSDLRVFALFVALFVAFFILDRDVESSFYVTQNMRGAVLGNEIPSMYSDDSSIGCTAGSTQEPLKWQKTYDDLTNVADWNLWVTSMALPTLWHSSHFGKSVGSNILLGGVRFRTIRVRSDSCSVNPDIIPNIDGLEDEQACYAPYSSGAESVGESRGESAAYLLHFNSATANAPRTKARYAACGEANIDASWTPPLTSGQITFYHCGGFLFEIPFRVNSSATGEYTDLPPEIAIDIYRQYACQGWVDDVATRLVAMEFFEYSPTFDTFLSTRVFFEVAAGGAWIPTDQLKTFALWTKAKDGQTVLDVFFLCFVFYYIGNFVADARRQSRRRRPLLAYFLQSWTVLEFCNMTLFLVSFGFRFAWYARSAEAHIRVDELINLGRYPGQLDQVEWLFMIQVYINSCNVILTFLKLLKYLRLNSRMNILTATLADCQDSIIGVLLIFILVVLAFSVTGNMLFGTQMYEYRSLSASFSTLMRMLMGEFDYEAMKQENRVLAGLFFWGFIILGLFILLNFLIGVISESFGNVSQRTVAMPLDRLVDKTKADLKVLTRPDVIKKWLKMRMRCATRESHLESCIDSMERWRDLTYVPIENEHGELEFREGEEEDDQTITRQEFVGAVCSVDDGRIIEDLGLPYIFFIWAHLVYEFHRSQEAEQMQEVMRKQTAFERGCRAALADKLKIIEQFQQRMENLSGVLDHMKSMLKDKGFAS